MSDNQRESGTQHEGEQEIFKRQNVRQIRYSALMSSDMVNLLMNTIVDL